MVCDQGEVEGCGRTDFLHVFLSASVGIRWVAGGMFMGVVGTMWRERTALEKKT